MTSEAKPGRRRAEQVVVEVKGGTNTFNFGVGLEAMGLVPARQTEKVVPEVRSVPKNDRTPNLMRGEIEILRLFVDDVFSEETRGVGDAGFVVQHENAIRRRARQTTVTSDDFRKVVGDIKVRSPKSTPKDLAAVLIHTVPQLRQLNHEQPEYVGAIARLSGAIQEYWEEPVKPQKPARRK